MVENKNNIDKLSINLIDIETSPNIAHVWGLFNQNVGLNQLMDSSRTLCFAAKRLGSKAIRFEREISPEDNKNVIDAAWDILDKADIVIHYNGRKFDIPTLNKEFILNGYLPPSPYKEIDLLQIARKRFKFPSNRLDYVADALGYGKKYQHEGHTLWVKCMSGDPEAWKIMEEYNKRDVKILEDVYWRMLPWIANHPNVGLMLSSDRPACTNCGGHNLESRGKRYSATQAYQRYRCKDCGTWQQSRFTCVPKENREFILNQIK